MPNQAGTGSHHLIRWSETPDIRATDRQIQDIKGFLHHTLRNLNPKQAEALIGAANLLQQRFTRLVSELVGKLSNTFMVTVDYAKSLPEMIKAGNYGYANEDITPKNFPITGEGKVDLEIVLVHFGKDIESDDVLAELDKLGLRAATLPELLALGETHPKVQREFPIIALGSVWANRDGDRDVPCLGDWGDRRELVLCYFGLGWDDDCRFAAVAK